MRTTRVIVGSLVAVGFGLLMAGPVWAHHAFAAEFDANRPFKIEGTVKEVEWTNPHVWFHINVKGPDGQIEEWKIEGGGPGSLTRRGFTKTYLPVGTEIVVEGFLSKGVPHRGNGRVMTFRDGRTLFVGSSGTGAPTDGNDPSDKK